MGAQPAKTTTAGYRDVLSQIWLLDPIPGWLPVRNQFSRLAQAPKHHLADPALAARLLGASPQSLLSHWLQREIGDDLLDAAVIYSGHHAYRRADGIAVIPAAMLAA